LKKIKAFVWLAGRKVVSWKLVFKIFCICLLLEKLINRKHFPVKWKFSLVFKKVFSFYFGRKILFRSCEKFRNIILFADYNKFGPQTFNCYIFCFESFCFSILPLRIWFHLFFILILAIIFMIVICFSYYFFNWIFLYIKFDHHSLDCYLFYLK
jgi:hypothetical protein